MSLLGPLDEHLNHQTSQPFRVPATTDHRFYDRHWFEMIAEHGQLLMLVGMGIYKNMGVADGFVVVQQDRRQTNVRVSRPLSDDLSARVGPLTIDVVTPFKRIDVSLERGDYPISAQLTWESSRAPYLEAPHHTFAEGRVIQDTSRYDQIGQWSGWIEVAGSRFEATECWGVRDHSWGVRPDIGGFEPSHGRRRNAMLWLWTFASTDDIQLHFQQREDAQGNVLHLDGEVSWPHTPHRTPQRITAVHHDIEFAPNSRDWTRLRYRIGLDDATQIELAAEALQAPWAYRGTGYENGYNDSKGVGAPRGTTVEHDVLDLTVPGHVTREGEPYFPGHREQPARVTIDGVPGFGHLPVMTSGRIERYNLGRR